MRCGRSPREIGEPVAPGPGPTTTTDVVLDAFDRCWHEFDDIVPPAHARTFPLPPRTRRRRRHVGRARQLHLLLAPGEAGAARGARDRTVAGSLTDVVERVLRHHLRA